jgi:hypothetical protein
MFSLKTEVYFDEEERQEIISKLEAAVNKLLQVLVI